MERVSYRIEIAGENLDIDDDLMGLVQCVILAMVQRPGHDFKVFNYGTGEYIRQDLIKILLQGRRDMMQKMIDAIEGYLGQ